jgi:hypothetical protein
MFALFKNYPLKFGMTFTLLRLSSFQNLKIIFLACLMLVVGQTPAIAFVTNSHINKFRAAFGSQVTITGSNLDTADRFIVTNNFSSVRWSFSFTSFEVISDTQVVLTLPTIDQLGGQGSDGMSVQLGLISPTQGSPSWAFWPIDLMLYENRTFDGSEGRIWCSTEGFAEISNKKVITHTSCSGEVNVPSGVTHIANSAFSGASGLTKISLPESLTIIEIQAFSGATGLTEISFPNSLTSIGDLAFSGATGLTDLTFPNSLISIGDYAFSGASGLTRVSMGSGLETVGDYSFYQASNLTELNLNSTITAIGQHAFNSAKLANLVIPNSVISIGTQAFVNNADLTSINIGSGLRSIENGVFFNNSKLKTVVIPNNIETISAQAFYGATAIETLTIGSSVREIQAQAFLTSTSIRALTLGESLVNIEPSAFDISTLSCITNKSNLDTATLSAAGINYLAPIPNCSVIPSAPTLNSLSGGDKSLTVTFTAGDDGGAEILDYEFSLNGGRFESANKSSSPINISNLAGRTIYSLIIRAQNSVGVGASSNALTARTLDLALDSSESKAREEAIRLSAINKSQADAQLIAYNGKIALDIVNAYQNLYTQIEGIILNIIKLFKIIYLIINKI